MGYSFKWILEHISQSFQTGSYSLTAGTASWAGTASYALTASYITASNVYGPYGSNSIISASYSVTASNATTASYVTGSIFSGSNPALSASYALTASYALNGGGSGLVTASGANTTIQFNSGGFFSGSTNFTFISQSNRVNLTGSFYVSGSIIQTGSMFISGAISASFGANTVGFFGTSSWAVSASWAPSTANISGQDQYLARFTGSNGIETGSIYNDRIYKYVLSGESNSIASSSHSHMLGFRNTTDVDASGNMVSSSLSAGQYTYIKGGDVAAVVNKATSAAGDYDFIQNLFASSAPRLMFSSWDRSKNYLYALNAGDNQTLLQTANRNIVVVVNKATNAAFIGAINTVTDDLVSNPYFEDTTGASNYSGRVVNVAILQTINPGFSTSNYRNTEIVMFLLDWGTNYYDTFANHAENIGTSAHGYGTHAEGYYTQARGQYTHAQNNESIAVGTGSMASGYKTVAGGKYTNANNIFTAAGPTAYLPSTKVHRSSRTYNNYYYDYGSGTTGGTTAITWFASDIAQVFANELITQSFDDYTNTLKCIVQIPAVNYIGVVELFGLSIGGVNRPTMIGDLLPDTIGRPTGTDTDYDIYITALNSNTFLETYNEYGGGVGYGGFAQGIETVAAGSASFVGGDHVQNFGNRSFAFGNNLKVTHNNAYVFGIGISAASQRSSLANNSFQVTLSDLPNLFVSGTYTGINTSTDPGFSGLSVNGSAKVTGNSYLGDGTTDVVAVTGSLQIKGSNTIAPVILASTSAPPAVAGGIYFDGTDFYLGFP